MQSLRGRAQEFRITTLQSEFALLAGENVDSVGILNGSLSTTMESSVGEGRGEPR